MDLKLRMPITEIFFEDHSVILTLRKKILHYLQSHRNLLQDLMPQEIPGGVGTKQNK